MKQILRKAWPMLLLLAAVPPVFASGSEVLVLLMLDLGLFMLVLASLALLRLSPFDSFLVFFAYLAGAVAAHWVTSDWPYRDNQIAINSICIAVPIATWAATAIYLRRRSRSIGPSAR